jgi:hypothetical protein
MAARAILVIRATGDATKTNKKDFFLKEEAKNFYNFTYTTTRPAEDRLGLSIDDFDAIL